LVASTFAAFSTRHVADLAVGHLPRQINIITTTFINSDVVLGLGSWTLVVLKEQISVLGPVLEGAVLAKDYIRDQDQRQHHRNNYLLNIIGF